jgi:hypothetical protein
MTNNEVQIKVIEGQTIMLDECNVGEFSILRLLLIIGISIGFTAFFWGIIGTTPTTATEPQALRPVTIIGMGICSFMLMCATGIQYKGVPGFSIRILGELNTRIYITKTTPEQDQKEVCRAVQELEPRAREISKKERELKRIAQGCK